MKRLTFLMLLVLSFGCALGTPPLDTDAISAEIAATLHRQTDAWNQGDLETFVSDYDAETTFISRGSILRGSTDLLERYEKAYPDSTRGQLEFAELEVDILSFNAAIVLGKYILSHEDRPDDTGRFTLVYKNLGGEWKIVHDHSSAAATE